MLYGICTAICSQGTTPPKHHNCKKMINVGCISKQIQRFSSKH